MVETSEGHVSSTSDSDETPHVHAGAGEMRVPPPAVVASAPLQLGRLPLKQ
jgi:hypothetical protein